MHGLSVKQLHLKVAFSTIIVGWFLELDNRKKKKLYLIIINENIKTIKCSEKL